MKTKSLSLPLAAIAIALAAHTARADDDASAGVLLAPIASHLPDGMSLTGNITIDAIGNSRGGRSRGSAPVVLTDFRLSLDLDKLVQAKGLSAYVHLMNHGLDRINADRVGALTGVTNIEASHSGTKLYRLWVEKEWKEPGAALRLGLFPLEDEFFTMEAAASFIHPTNGPQGDYAGTLGAAIYNHAGFGARLRLESDDRSRYAMFAILDRPLDDTNFVRTSGLSFPRAPGTQAMVELGLTPLEASGDETPERFDKTAIGIWAYSRGDDHLSRLDSTGQPLRARSNGWYALKERTLWASNHQPGALAGFIRVSGGDGRAYAVDRAINAGLRLAGWVPGRNADVSAVMVVLQRLGPAWRERALNAGLAPAPSENVLELNHRIALHPSLAVMPLVQWISQPGGLRQTASSRVIGARVTIAL